MTRPQLSSTSVIHLLYQIKSRAYCSIHATYNNIRKKTNTSHSSWTFTEKFLYFLHFSCGHPLKRTAKTVVCRLQTETAVEKLVRTRVILSEAEIDKIEAKADNLRSYDHHSLRRIMSRHVMVVHNCEVFAAFIVTFVIAKLIGIRHFKF